MPKIKPTQADNMTKRLFGLIVLLLTTSVIQAQVLSESKKKEILTNYQKHIKNISAISSENVDMMPVYQYQLESANIFMEENQKHNSDNDIYARWIELKTLVKQNTEVVEFMVPRMSDWYYRKAVSAKINKQPKQAHAYIQKSLEINPLNVMANYELAQITLDSGQITNTTDRLTDILHKMNPSEEESMLCKNLLAYTYDKNLILETSEVLEKIERK